MAWEGREISRSFAWKNDCPRLDTCTPVHLTNISPATGLEMDECGVWSAYAHTPGNGGRAEHPAVGDEAIRTCSLLK